MVNKIFIDANIFLEIFLQDIKSEECKSFLKSLNEGKEAFTSDFIVYSCILQVQNKLKDSKLLKKTIIFFNSFNINIIRPSLEDFYNATRIMETIGLDFDDSLVVACMKSQNIEELVSLDKHFDKVKGIKRINL